MNYYIIAPAKISSGGPELAHQMCSELLKLGKNAKMYYAVSNSFDPEDVPAIDKFKKYNTTHCTDKCEAETADSIVIFNESTTSFIPQVNSGRKILWWMSVDNYLYSDYKCDEADIINQIDLHIVQSAYAFDYVKNTLHISDEKIMFVSDYISETYGTFIFPADYRKNYVLYNPKKGYEDLKPLIEKATWINWIPLNGYSEEEMILLMESSKIYVDFGNHPGKDRIPREAASCGLCVITNKKGSAAYSEDVPINDKYKFENVNEDLDRINQLMKEICENFSLHMKDFDEYRSIIKQEKKLFSSSVVNMVNYMEAL